jgi:hypothetical protein
LKTAQLHALRDTLAASIALGGTHNPEVVAGFLAAEAARLASVGYQRDEPEE